MILQGTLRDINEARGQRQLNYFKMKSTFHARIEVLDGWRLCGGSALNDSLDRAARWLCSLASRQVLSPERSYPDLELHRSMITSNETMHLAGVP